MRIRRDLHGVFMDSRILLVILVQPLDLACFYIVYSAGDLLLSEQRILFRGKGSADLLASAEDIPVAGRTRVFFLTDGFPDGIYDVADVSVGFAMPVWPRMTTRGVFKWDTAYSMEPSW